MFFLYQFRQFPSRIEQMRFSHDLCPIYRPFSQVLAFSLKARCPRHLADGLVTIWILERRT